MPTLQEVRQKAAQRYCQQSAASVAAAQEAKICSQCGYDKWSIELCPRTGIYHDYSRRSPGGVKFSTTTRSLNGRDLVNSLNAARIEPPKEPSKLVVRCDSTTLNDFIDYAKKKAWRKMRYGICYGKVEYATKGKEVLAIEVHSVYEPPQNSGEDTFEVLPDPNEANVDAVAYALGLCRVGIVYTIPKAEKLLTGAELLRIAAMQSVYGEHCVILRISTVAHRLEVHCQTEPYQATAQCVDLYRLNYFTPSEDPECVHSRTALEVISTGITKKEMTEIPCVPMTTVLPITGMTRPTDLRNVFDRVNRDDMPVLKMSSLEGVTLAQRISDFHIMLYLFTCPQGNPVLSVEHDLENVSQAVLKGTSLSREIETKITRVIKK